jgi:phage shock protein C
MIMNYPGHHPRRLHRSRNNRWIGGVCGGLAEYLNMDPTLVRVLVVLIAVVTSGVPVLIAYLLLMLLMPEAEPGNPSSIGPVKQTPWQQQWRQNQYQPPQQQQTADPVWGQAGPPWQHRDPNLDTSQPQPPRQAAEDLFSRAKHPTKPNDPTTGNPTPDNPAPSNPTTAPENAKNAEESETGGDTPPAS